MHNLWPYTCYYNTTSSVVVFRTIQSHNLLHTDPWSSVSLWRHHTYFTSSFSSYSGCAKIGQMLMRHLWTLFFKWKINNEIWNFHYLWKLPVNLFSFENLSYLLSYVKQWKPAWRREQYIKPQLGKGTGTVKETGRETFRVYLHRHADGKSRHIQ